MNTLHLCLPGRTFWLPHRLRRRRELRVVQDLRLDRQCIRLTLRPRNSGLPASDPCTMLVRALLQQPQGRPLMIRSPRQNHS